MKRNWDRSKAVKWLGLILVGCLAGSTLAVTEPAKKKTDDSAPKFPAAASSAANTSAPKPPPAKLPDEFQLNMLIRSMVIAVNQANKTGNYTVLRDLGSPRFRKSNSAERLAAIFEAQRKSKFDLSPILFFTPKLLRPAELSEEGMLRMTGFFDTRPQRVAFDFLFEDIKGEWQLYGINIATTAAPSGAAPATPAGQ
jgi:hypothetical protein